MDRSFDLVALLKQQPTTKSHKIRPTQFVSVAGGIQKRLETNIKNRKSCRSSVFDKIRNIAKCETPKASTLSNAQQKALHRKQQLEKWKEEKEKKKKEAAAQKKKPFVAGVSQRKSFGPPPPAKPMPSTSGRVTRSQARQKIEPKPNTQTQSFAPSNASFKPPQFSDVPILAPVNKKKTYKSKPNITFEPVLPKNLQKGETRSTRAKPIVNTQKPIDSKTRKPNEKIKAKAKNLPQRPPLKQHMFQSSSSSSDMEQKETKQSLKKSIPMAQDSTKPSRQISIPKIQDSTKQSRQKPILQESTSMSQDSASSISQDSASMSSQDELPSTPKSKIPNSESSSEEKLRTPKTVGGLTPEQIIEEAKNISPCVTMARGKDNARKEMKQKLDEGLLDEDNSNMDSVNHFRRQLDSEVSRLSAMCDIWDQIFAQNTLPEPIQELVLTAVGQGRLLVAQKLQQFAGLVENCARPVPGASLVTPADLHGFWDLVFMQVENVDLRFKKLEELRLRDWVDEEQEPEAKKVVAKPVAKKPAAKPSGGASRLREMIAAARKAKKVQESQSENSESEKSEASPVESKTFEAGFFSVTSPLKRGSAPGTPANKSTLLKSVLSSEARKSVSKNSMSFAIMRASALSKTVDIEGLAVLPETPIAPVNLYATPARSILKQNNPTSSRKVDKLKTVLFHESDAEVPSSPVSYASCDKSIETVEVEVPPADEKENNPTPRRRSRISRQNACEQSSPVMTRSRRKSAQTPLLEPDSNAEPKKRSTRNTKATPDPETPKRSTRRRKSAAAV